VNITLRGKVLATILGTLLIGIIISVSITSITITQFANQSSDLTFNTMREEELNSLDRLALDRSLLVEEYFAAVSTDVEVMFDFASNLFNNNITGQPRTTYWADPAIDARQPPGSNTVSDYNGFGFASWDYSTIFVPGVENPTDYNNLPQTTQEMINQSSMLDYVFQSIHASNPNYIWIYMGFEENNLFRQLPYNDMSWAKSDGGYKATEENWYTSAVAADGLNIFLDKDPESGLVVTASKPIKDQNNDLIGVISVDLPIDVVEQSIAGEKIIQNGYAFMIDDQDRALIHPKLVANADLFGSSITDLEDTDFSNALTQIHSNIEGRTDYSKNGGRWYASYADVLDGKFTILVVVPESDILIAPNAIQHNILISLRNQFINFLLLIVVITALIALFTNYASQQVVEPIKELTEVTDLIAKGNLSKDLSSQYQSSSEISLLYESFRGLITTLRFGNQDYYAGDLNRAMSNYESALQLFTNLDNQTGVGICYNNIGNIHRARGNLKDANTYYRQAVDIGKELLEKAPEDEKKQHVIALASRYNNLGLLYQEIEEFDRAVEYMKEALKYDQMIDNARGFATRYGNLGLIHLETEDFKAAKQSFEEAESIAKSIGSERAMLYVTMNWGIYDRATGDLEKAKSQFLTASEKATDLDIRVVTTSLRNLQEIYEEEGNTDLASEIEERLNQVAQSTKVKEVTFVLDYSGSMAGRRIRAAVDGMRNIFKGQINDQDKVSIITFDTNTTTHVEPRLKGEHIKEFMLTFDNLDRPYGATAMYDALGTAFANYLSNPSSSTQWIILLTDGDDNSSKSYNAERVTDMAIESIGVNLVIIGVGNISDRAKLEAICNATDRGKYIDVSQGVSDAITTAFEEVGSMLSEVEVEGFIPDY